MGRIPCRQLQHTHTHSPAHTQRSYSHRLTSTINQSPGLKLHPSTTCQRIALQRIEEAPEFGVVAFLPEESTTFVIYPWTPALVMRRRPRCAAPWAAMADLTSAYTSCVAMRLLSASGKKGTATFQVMMQLGCSCCCSSCKQSELSTASGCPGSTCTAIRSSRSAGQSRDSQHRRAAAERSRAARMYSWSSNCTQLLPQRDAAAGGRAGHFPLLRLRLPLE